MEQWKIQEFEYELWEAAKKRRSEVFEQTVYQGAAVISNSLRCTGEEYGMMLQDFGLEYYTIEQYETVQNTADRIQNYYFLKVKTEGMLDVKSCHATSTWERLPEGWRLMFHMHTAV